MTQHGRGVQTKQPMLAYALINYAVNVPGARAERPGSLSLSHHCNVTKLFCKCTKNCDLMTIALPLKLWLIPWWSEWCPLPFQSYVLFFNYRGSGKVYERVSLQEVGSIIIDYVIDRAANLFICIYIDVCTISNVRVSVVAFSICLSDSSNKVYDTDDFRKTNGLTLRVGSTLLTLQQPCL